MVIVLWLAIIVVFWCNGMGGIQPGNSTIHRRSFLWDYRLSAEWRKAFATERMPSGIVCAQLIQSHLM